MRIYYGDRKGRAAMDGLYRQFVNPGDLVFDLGAHVGNRIGSFRRRKGCLSGNGLGDAVATPAAPSRAGLGEP